jgi:hypothetical protein
MLTIHGRDSDAYTLLHGRVWPYCKPRRIKPFTGTGLWFLSGCLLTLLFIQSSSLSSPVAMSNTHACTLGVAKPSLQRPKYQGSGSRIKANEPPPSTAQTYKISRHEHQPTASKAFAFIRQISQCKNFLTAQLPHISRCILSHDESKVAPLPTQPILSLPPLHFITPAHQP